jgi:glyoxylase-like metal-dependent hydrolase (beta-lactamase superfamily II)
VIDPGCSIESLRRLLKEENKELRDIDTIILSHIHPDHITHAVRIKRLSNCRIVANDITTPLFDNKEEMKRFLGFHQGQAVRSLWEDLVNEHMYGALDDGRVDEVVHDGDTYSCGDITLRMLYTPGHLPDHMCIEILEPNYIFAADIDCTEFGPFYGHPKSSIPDFVQSIIKLQHNDYRGLISGHLEKSLIIDYKPALGAYARQFRVRDELVHVAIQDGATTIEEISVTPIVYPSLTNPVFLQFEKWMIEHHVTNLKQRGLVEEENGRLKIA